MIFPQYFLWYSRSFVPPSEFSVFSSSIKYSLHNLIVIAWSLYFLHFYYNCMTQSCTLNISLLVFLYMWKEYVMLHLYEFYIYLGSLTPRYFSILYFLNAMSLLFSSWILSVLHRTVNHFCRFNYPVTFLEHFAHFPGPQELGWGRVSFFQSPKAFFCFSWPRRSFWFSLSRMF